MAGTYRLVGPGIERRIYVEDGKLFLDRAGGRHRLLPLMDGRILVLGDEGAVFEEVPAEAGQPLRFRWLVNGQLRVTLERVSER
jgi:hypothetical protein